MSSGHMSRRRAFSASDGNRDNTTRYTHANASVVQARDPASQFGRTRGSSPPRIFIKPKAGVSSQTSANVNDRPALARRASLIAVPTNQQQQRNTRRASSLTSTKPVHIPRRSTSLHYTAINPVNSMNMPASKLPRSTTSMTRHAPAKPAANCGVNGVNGDVGHSIQSSVSHKKVKAAVTRVTRAPSSSIAKNNKENDSSSVLAPERTSAKHTQPVPKRNTSTRKQPSLVPELRKDGSPLRRVFLRSKANESAHKPPVPRRSSSRSAFRSEKEDRTMTTKKSSLPSLPTITMEHTPLRTTSVQGLFDEVLQPEGSSDSGISRTEVMSPVSKSKPKYRPFLLPRRVGSLTSLSSIFSLPSQVLKHTPLKSQSSDSPSSSPCLSKARTKTIWTMMDEIKLIRTGGLLQNADVLAPGHEVRVVPLCQRLRNGSDASDSPGDRALRRTPVRSSSTPYHLGVSSVRRSRHEEASALPPIPSITSALAHARTEWEHHRAEDRLRTTNDGEKYNSTPVDVKKPANQCLQRRSTLGKPMISPGYGLSIMTRDTMTARKPSLLTRAHTLVKLKFSGSKRVVGRGNPMWTEF